MTNRIILSFCLLASLSSCYYDKEALLYPPASDCSTVNVSFNQDILPLVQTNCAFAGCHGASSSNKGGPFTNYTQIKNKASIIKSVTGTRIMPQGGGSLTAEQIKLISCWVDAGAPNN